MNNTMSSDKSSIIVLSNSFDHEILNSNIYSSTITTSSSNQDPNSQKNSARIQCLNESQTNTTHIFSSNSSSSTNSLNDGISVLNTISHEKSDFGLEKQVELLNEKLNLYKQENQELKEQYNYLHNRLENKQNDSINRAKTLEHNDSTASDDQFIDVKTDFLIEKIEQYIKEADRMFVNEFCFKPAMYYLINHFWSIIAYQYNDENLGKLKLLRDSLLSKIDNVDKKLQEDTSIQHKQPAVTTTNSNTSSNNNTSSSINSSINVIDFENEMEMFKQEAMALKNKLSQQNELVKSLIQNLSQSENVTLSTNCAATSNAAVSSEPAQVENQETPTCQTQEAKPEEATEVKQEESENENVEEEKPISISPGSSPTSFMFNYFQKKYKSAKDKMSKSVIVQPTTTTTTTTTTPDPNQSKFTVSNIEITFPTSPRSENQQSSMSSSIASVATSPNSSNNNEDYFYYNVNDYIAIDKNIGLSQHMVDEKKRPSSDANLVQEEEEQNVNSSLNDDDSIQAIPSSLELTENQNNDVTADSPHSLETTSSKTLTHNLSVYQCPVCQLTVDSKSIPFEKYEAHVQKCTNNSEILVCMFCLSTFAKQELYEYELHVDQHISEEASLAATSTLNSFGRFSTDQTEESIQF